MTQSAPFSTSRLPARPQPLPVEFQIVGSSERHAGWLSEFTLAGAILESTRKTPLPNGTRVRVFVQSMAFDGELSLRALMRWERRAANGVQFFRLTESDVQALMELIAAAESVARTAGPTRRT